MDFRLGGALYLSGLAFLGGASFVPGSIYYLSSTVPGAVTLTPSAVKIGVAVSASSMIIQIEQGTGWNTGDQKTTYNPNEEIGWILKQNGSIGNAASGATIRANADTVFLYSLLWNSTTNANCPVSGGRGAGAAADFAANKTLTLPVCDGTVDVNIGTSSYALGAAFGAETVALTAANNGPHDHGVGVACGTPEGTGLSGPGDRGGGGSTTGSSGFGTPFDIHQPSTAVWMKIKL
jgi:hypothetical protein